MGHSEENEAGPALQVIVLGSGGGPMEDNTTAFLVRSTAEKWKKGSLLAVDAGTHLASISRIIEPFVLQAKSETPDSPRRITSGPFEGLELPYTSVGANAAHVTRLLVDTYLITHPHLDHISGFVVNTAALPGSRPKRLAGLPTTIAAFKTHIFNNVIWPNLSDENNGAGLVTYMRLVEGGSPALGNGEGKGYVEICEGLSVKTWSVSHGHCIENHSHRGSGAGLHPYTPHSAHGSELLDSQPMTRSYSNPLNPAMTHVGFSHLSPARYDGPSVGAIHEHVCVYDSSAYFIRDIATSAEVLIFGDVEPDSISLSPRNWKVWEEAGPKIASGLLKGIFIECSYDNSQSDDTLFGHLAPRFLIEELTSLASEVHKAKLAASSSPIMSANGPESKKRKYPSHDIDTLDAPSYSLRSTRPRKSSGLVSETFDVSGGERNHSFDSVSGAGISPSTKHPPTFESDSSSGNPALELPDRALPKGLLEGVKVVIIHVKDKLNDGPPAGDKILEQMEEYEIEIGLGCEFEIAKTGMSVYF